MSHGTFAVQIGIVLCLKLIWKSNLNFCHAGEDALDGEGTEFLAVGLHTVTLCTNINVLKNKILYDYLNRNFTP